MSSRNSIHVSEKHSANRARDSAEWNGRLRDVADTLVGLVADVGRVSSSVSPESKTTVTGAPESEAAFAERS